MTQQPNRQPLQFVILILALLLPTLVTWVYFEVLHGTDSWVQQGAYGVGKAIQFLLPVVWVAIFFRHRLKWLQRGQASESEATIAETNPVPRAATIPAAVGFGLTVVVLLIAIFVIWIQPQPMSVSLHDKVAEKVASIGMDSTGRFILLAVFTRCFIRFWKSITGVGLCTRKPSCLLRRWSRTSFPVSGSQLTTFCCWGFIWAGQTS